MDTKQCTKCCCNVPIQYFRLRKNKTTYTQCRACLSSYRKVVPKTCRVIYISEELDKYCLRESLRMHARLNGRKYRAENPDRYANNNLRYNERNPKAAAKTQAKFRSDLKDSYIITSLVDNNSNNELNRSDITPELIELKRKQLKLHRDVKNYKQA